MVLIQNFCLANDLKIYTFSNELDFDFPYQGGSTGTLTIRRKDGSEDVMLSVSKGQFMGNYADRRRVNLRFDDKQAFTVGYTEPSDSSSDMIFLGSEKKIIAEMQKASKLKVQAEFFN